MSTLLRDNQRSHEKKPSETFFRFPTFCIAILFSVFPRIFFCMSSNDQLVQLEQLAQTVYTTSDQDARTRAEGTLRAVCNDVAFIPQCQVILDRSQNPYALLLASSSLLKLFVVFYSTFGREQKIEIRMEVCMIV